MSVLLLLWIESQDSRCRCCSPSFFICYCCRSSWRRSSSSSKTVALLLLCCHLLLTQNHFLSVLIVAKGLVLTVCTDCQHSQCLVFSRPPKMPKVLSPPSLRRNALRTICQEFELICYGVSRWIALSNLHWWRRFDSPY